MNAVIFLSAAAGSENYWRRQQTPAEWESTLEANKLPLSQWMTKVEWMVNDLNQIYGELGNY